MDAKAPASKTVAPRTQSPISFEVVVDRVELVRHFGEEQEDSLTWDVYLYSVPSAEGRSGSPNYLLVGLLFCVSDAGHGQARANAMIRAYDEKGDPMSPEFVRERMAYGFVEPTYDACRRTLEAQAALMDLDIELPRLSPVTQIMYEELESKSKQEAPTA